VTQDVIDLRSDTVTQPTEEMRDAMRSAEVGDDAYGEDPTVRRLEESAAQRLGKEAALFVPSGTMGNLIAVTVHTRRGEEIILEERCHTMNYELGGMASVAGVMPRPVWADRGHLTPDLVEPVLHPGDGHRSRTGLIVLENTHNLAGGTVCRPEVLEAVISLARARGVAVHLDGARLFNAAVALDVDVEELAVGFDSVMFCLSKGLSAPAGSLLLGDREFVDSARRVRGMLGGGMRQSGVLAAAGIVALETMPQRLAEDHENASVLANHLSRIPDIEVDAKGVETNIVIFAVGDRLSAHDLVEKMRANGVLACAFDPFRIRMVTHYGVSRGEVEEAARLVAKILE